MNIMAKLTLRHLKENMKRTIVTIIGIVMATALISAILMGAFSAFKFFGYVTLLAEGNVHLVCYKLPEDAYNKLQNDDRVETVGLAIDDPEMSGVRLLTDVDERLRVGNIVNADRAYYDVKVTCDYEGTLPTNSGEIAVEQKFLEDNGLDLGIGDSLTFEQGNRYSYDEEGNIVYWAGNYRSEEAFDVRETSTCTITAILHENKPTRGYDMLCGIDEGNYPGADNAYVTVTLKKCDHTANTQLNDIISKCGIEHCDKNSEYLICNFAFEGSADAYIKFFSMMLIGLGVVVFTSVVLIVNSFGMSLTERMKYLGMLASVGATGKQKRFTVYFEGFILGVVGIPLGILAGIIGTKITLYVLGTKILEANMIRDAEGIRGGIPLYTSPLLFLSIVFVSGLTILISLLAPSIKASRVMPVDALRQTGTVKVRARKLRANPLFKKIFGYEGELAYKNIKRNGIKSTVISVSITISVILFLTIDYFCTSVDKVNKFDYSGLYQVYASCYLEDKDRLFEDLSQIEGIDKIYLSDMIVFPFRRGKRADGTEVDTVLANTEINDPSFRMDAYADLSVDGMMVTYVDDEVFTDLLEKNGLSADKYFGDTLRGVLINSYFHEKVDNPIYKDSIVGQVLHYDEPVGNPPAVEIGDLIPYGKDNFAYDLAMKNTITIIVPESMYFEKSTETLAGIRQTVSFAILTDNAEEVEAAIEDLFAKGEYEYYSSGDLTRSLVIMDTVTLILKTSMFGFTTLLTLIAVANIINTISTGVLLRRKEFAMYRSVGMDEHGFKKMIRLETFLYGIRAVLIGIPVSILLQYWMYSQMEDNLFAFIPNYNMYPVVILVVFAVIGLSMLMSINKIKNDEIIDVLKEDIC